MPPDTIAALLAEGRERLRGSETASLDARLLLQAACGVSHDEVIGAAERIVVGPAANRYRELVGRRAAHEPVARILGEREFYGRSFRIGPAVLDPRPDTETLIAAVLGAARERRDSLLFRPDGPPMADERSGEKVNCHRSGGKVTVNFFAGAASPRSEPATRKSKLSPAWPCSFLDLGTGSGAIAITLLSEWPEASGMATDISAAALGIARANAERHGVGERLRLVQGNWFDGVRDRFDVIISNPPYIATADIETLMPEVRAHDPHLALDGGPDGLEAYRRIAAGAVDHLRPKGRVVVEIGAGQGAAVERIFGLEGFTLESRHRDLASIERCLVFQHDEK